jgi:hypothetical protein
MGNGLHQRLSESERKFGQAEQRAYNKSLPI